MTLRELLNMANPDEFIYVGSHSAYIFIGTVAECKDVINNLGDEYKAMYDRSLEECGKRIQRYKDGSYEREVKKRMNACRGRMQKCYEQLALTPQERNSDRTDEDLRYEIKERKKMLERYQRQIDNIPNMLEKEFGNLIEAEGRVERYKPMLDRIVRDVYKRVSVKPLGTVILTFGDEWGMYWDLEEYERDHKKAPKSARSIIDELWDNDPDCEE